ncbi:ATP-binding protein [Paraglaciecola hydrolytica]|uniref:histidine kinase n=1 Tax=Paraglaciecola hydrolytica TaxID=1799789 RepID=A0A136A3E1_9ALTE|nr:ATP-binding protein [Paraglaciecola hydrolytica]KXI29761.1 ATPase [Paraglaciecola hydrolytica]
MRNLSLRFRSFAAAILTLVIFIPLTAITLEKAFNNSLSQSMLQQLRVQSLTLISEFEFEDNHPVMPELLFNDQLNVPDSGLYAFVLMANKLVWKSQSTLNWRQNAEFIPPPIGTEQFIEEFNLTKSYFLFSYTAEFEAEKGYQPVSFFILQDKSIFNTEKDKFAHTLWYWLGLIALLLLVLLLASLNAALLPINRLNQQIKQAESGQLRRIDQQYPPELDKLKNSINHLLNSEEQQRARYKNSLSDLAHSLKTPLAVLAGNTELPEDAKEPVQQINLLIQRQLKRAVIGGHSGWEQAVEIKPIVLKLVNAMHKVYIDKGLELNIDEVDANVGFQGDTTDLMEILGNVLDNACKAARKKVVIKCTMTKHWLQISVEEDGPGIPADKRLLLLERGIRLDSYTEGQGIGMAVVADLVSAYQGQLNIESSTLGGALILLKFQLK